MIWVLFAVESLLVSVAGTGVVAAGLWLVPRPWAWPLAGVGLGFAVRTCRRSLGLVAGWHGAVRRRIEER